MRSMRSTPTGGRPLPAFGYTGSIRAHSSRHGTTRSISARNCARRVVLVYFSKPVPASVICLRAIITSRGRPLPVSSQHVGLKRERVIQRFPSLVSPKKMEQHVRPERSRDRKENAHGHRPAYSDADADRRRTRHAGTLGASADEGGVVGPTSSRRVGVRKWLHEEARRARAAAEPQDAWLAGGAVFC